MSEKSFAYKFYTTANEAWDAMYQAILEAQKSVFWEIYAIGNDEVGQKFINLLIQKAQAGLEIKIIADHLGSFSLTSAQQNDLRQAGIDLVIYNEVFQFQFNFYKCTTSKCPSYTLPYVSIPSNGSIQFLSEPFPVLSSIGANVSIPSNGSIQFLSQC